MGNKYDIFISCRRDNGEEKARKQNKFLSVVGYKMFFSKPIGKAKLLYPSFGASLVLLWSPHGDSEKANNGFEDGSMRCVTGKIGGMVIEADLLPHEPMFVE